MVSSLLGQSRDSNISVEEIKISNLLFMTVLGFAICWIPSLIIITMDRVAPDATPPRSRTLLCTYLNYLSAALNPFIYGVMNRSFRAEYKRILLCRKTQIDVPQVGSKAIRTFRSTARAAVIWKTRIASDDKVEMSTVASHKEDISDTFPLENGDLLLGNSRSSSPCSGVVSFSHISRTSSPTLEWKGNYKAKALRDGLDPGSNMSSLGFLKSFFWCIKLLSNSTKPQNTNFQR